jgi:hypothetical protein
MHATTHRVLCHVEDLERSVPEQGSEYGGPTLRPNLVPIEVELLEYPVVREHVRNARAREVVDEVLGEVEDIHTTVARDSLADLYDHAIAELIVL